MGKNSSLASHVSKTMIMMSSNLVTMGITDMTMINATLELSKSWLLSQDFHISMLKPLLPLMTELVQWSFHHREQVPEALKEVWFSIVNFLDFNEVLNKDVHNETKKMFGGFLDSLLTKCESSLSKYFVQALVNKLVQGTKQYFIEVYLEYYV